MTQAVATRADRGEALAGRLFESAVAAMDVFSVYLGEQLGYYRALADHGPLTPHELAARTGTSVRYAREWLEQQATTEILDVEMNATDPDNRRFRLPAEHLAVLTDSGSDLFVAPVGRFISSSIAQAPRLLEAFRTGGGVGWRTFGEDMRTAQADFNRPFFLNHLAQDFIAQIPPLPEVLARPGARSAEIGPGGGWAAIALARAYPGLAVDGFDLDPASVEMARQNVEAEGLAGRVSIHHRDAGDPALAGAYDLVCAFECIHDLADPVEVLTTMRRLAKPEGTVIVMDERVPEEFGPTGGLTDRLLYGFSLAVCLPDGMSRQPSAATGTVMRPATLRRYAREAGFRDIEILPLEHEMFRFYLMKR